jgi:signal transduction histidine kinase
MLDRVAAELGLGLTPALRDQMAQEQLRMVLTHTRVGTMAATLFAQPAAWHFRGLVPSWQVDAWIVAKLLIAGARIGLAQGFGRWRERTLASAAAQPAAERGRSRRWLRWTLLLLAIDGVVWGVAAYRMMGEAQTTAVLVMAAVDAVTCVATFGLQAHLPSTIAYVAPMLLASALGLAQRGDDIAVITASCQLILLALQLSTAHGTTRRLSAGFLLRLNAQQLAAEKDAALALAQQQSALRAQFLAKISHELRTPLHGILGLARLLHLESADPQVTRQVELIESSGSHLLGLINDLLDVSRTESGRFPLRSERFELRQEIQQVAEVFALRAADRGLAFHWHADLPSPHWVHGDAARLRQVLHNLLGNAVKFTREGEISLDVMLAGEDTVRLTVRDTGPGIGEAEQGRIFQPFHQAERAGNAPTDGVGLGLTIAREIAQAMGGAGTSRSTPGPGRAPASSSAPGSPRRRPCRAASWPRARRAGNCRAGCWWRRTTTSMRSSSAATWNAWASRTNAWRMANRPPAERCATPTARTRADGLPHASDGWPGRHARDPHAGMHAEPVARADHRAHRDADRQRPPRLPGRRHGQGHRQAVQP